jgi:small-conductance mechanosensitive channel
LTLEEILEYLFPLLIFAEFVVVGLLFRYALESYVVKFARKTKTKIDDIVVDAFKTPLVIIFAIGGSYVALQWVEVPSAIANWIYPLLFLGIGIAAIIGTMRVLSGLITYFGSKYPGMKPIVPVLRKLINIAVLFVGFMMILDWLGISINPLLMSFGIAGLAVALALRPTLENLFSGLHIMMERSICQDDYIELDSGEKGYVVDIGWRTTKIRMLPNNIVMIPNSKLASSKIINYHRPEQEMACLVQVGVSYDSDLRKVEKVTIEVGKEVLREIEGGVPEFEPFIRYHTFDDFSINFTVILRVKEFVDKYLITHEFVKRLHERYNKEGIVIPFPIRTVQMEKIPTKKGR